MFFYKAHDLEGQRKVAEAGSSTDPLSRSFNSTIWGGFSGSCLSSPPLPRCTFPVGALVVGYRPTSPRRGSGGRPGGGTPARRGGACATFLSGCPANTSDLEKDISDMIPRSWPGNLTPVLPVRAREFDLRFTVRRSNGFLELGNR